MATMLRTTTTPSDDVVREILLRLDDVPTLFRCAATCKRWRRLIAKPSFLVRRQWPSYIVGFFTNLCLGTASGPTDSSSRQLAFVPLPGSSLHGTHPRALSSFLRADDASAAAALDGAVPLDTRGGLLLVRLYLRGDDGDRKPNTFILAPECNPIVRLGVCNLLAGTWDVLPELNCQSSRFASFDEYCCGIVPRRVARDGSSAFKVLMIGKDKEKSQYNLHTFDSGEASWRAPTKCFDMMERQIWSIEHKKVVVSRGYAHLLFVSEFNDFHVLNVNVETGDVSLTKLIGPAKDWLSRSNMGNYQTVIVNNQRKSRDLWGANSLVTTSNGARLSLCSYKDRRLKIWTQQEDAVHKQSGYSDAEWRITREIDHNLTELILQLYKPFCFWSGETSGTLLITESYHGESLYMAHLDTGTLEEASKQFLSHAPNGIMPMEIDDWPTFFMSRLGGS